MLADLLSQRATPYQQQLLLPWYCYQGVSEEFANAAVSAALVMAVIASPVVFMVFYYSVEPHCQQHLVGVCLLDEAYWLD